MFLTKCYTQEDDVEEPQEPEDMTKEHRRWTHISAYRLTKRSKRSTRTKDTEKQRMQRVEGLVSLLEANPSSRGNVELRKEIENYIDKSNNIAAGLQYLILQETTDEGIEKYECEMQALDQKDGDLVTHARAAMLKGPEPEAALNAGLANNQSAANAPVGTLHGIKHQSLHLQRLSSLM